ncbi:LysR family transcriptional regulator [Clostridium sp. A1-XYC3]|uniref:LysR family transcriptional regulator n=1 Tax=Clostridium tanneri TaxID=3037988 RepID=A0ABU4JYE3_9CLOT|nr:LysR family transcriptional regulator [Clostridium sp. A1-XYC3]MDW8803127.1 LysR family transcriptional regulator [Clostridium sp. A1-XYC3]
MDIRKLEYFLAAVEEGSFTKAALKCYISQTAISQQIASMEQELGLKLFDRSEYRPKLTFSGKSFYQSSKQLVEKYYEAVRKAKLLEQGYHGSISIGITGPIEKKFLPPVLRRFSMKYPDINIQMKEKNFSQSVKELEKNTVDVVFGIGHDIEGAKNVEVFPLFTSNICVITAVNHPWHEQSEVYGYDLRNENLIVFSKDFSTVYYQSVVDACRKDGFEPNIEKEADSFDELLLMVSANNGVAIVSEEVMTQDDNIHMLKLKDTHHKSEYCIARNRTNKKPIIDDFIKATLEGFNTKNHK